MLSQAKIKNALQNIRNVEYSNLIMILLLRLSVHLSVCLLLFLAKQLKHIRAQLLFKNYFSHDSFMFQFAS